MFRKKISEGILFGILIYLTFISVLYFRMRIANNRLADYDDRLCPSSFDCRRIFDAEILDYGLNDISFTNYGPKGIPLESGTFVEYVFTLSIEGLGTRMVKVLPNTTMNTTGFDVENIYIPTKSDPNLLNGSLFRGKKVDVEIWRDQITLILIGSNAENDLQPDENRTEETISLGPTSTLTYERAIPTSKHPLLLSEFSTTDFNGWTTGIVFMLITTTVIGGGGAGLFIGIDWLINRWRKNDKPNRTFTPRRDNENVDDGSYK